MNIKQNILKWYPFRENASVLEIYDNESILTENNQNIKLQTCSIRNLVLKGSFDYITLIGTYEYAPVICDEEKSYSEFLKILKKHLNENGTILIAIDNRLGVKYLAGGKNKEYSYIFEGMENKIQRKKSNLLLKQELIKFINEAEFVNYKFYYPLPDYKYTNSIFTDKFLPKSNSSKILYPVKYDEGSRVLYNEINILKQICDMGQFEQFTNSYLVEISDSKIDNDIKFVNYNIFRKNKYKLQLVMKENRVEKTAENPEALEHIKTIESNIKKLEELGFNVLEKVEQQKIISKFVEKAELDKILVEIIEKNDKEYFKAEIEKWYSYIKNKLTKSNEEEIDIFSKYNIEVPIEIKRKLHFVKEGYIDLSFENIFLENDYLLYDQEWYLENVPIQFILYRAINNLYTYNEKKLQNKISKEELLEKFSLKEYETYFEELEKNIQYEILNMEFFKEYQNETRKYCKKIEEYDKTIIELEKRKDKEKKDEIEEIQRQNEKIISEEKIKYIQLMAEKKEIEEKYGELLHEYNTSRGWKVIKTLRKVIRKK